MSQQYDPVVHMKFPLLMHLAKCTYYQTSSCTTLHFHCHKHLEPLLRIQVQPLEDSSETATNIPGLMIVLVFMAGNQLRILGKLVLTWTQYTLD